MDQDESRGLLHSILGIFARKPPEKSAPPASVRSQALEAWLRTDAYLHHETDDLDQIDPEHLARTLSAFEDLIQHDPDRTQDSAAEQSIHRNAQYPKLQMVRSMKQRPNPSAQSNLQNTVSFSKRKRENDAAIQELSLLDREAKKRRVLPREELTMSDDNDKPGADFAMSMRRHLMSLDNALRTHWICVCQKCSGLSVRLSLPQQTKKGLPIETCFEVFFGARSVLANTLQEAKITIPDPQNNGLRRSSEPTPSTFPEFVHICQSVMESLDHRNCLHLALENGSFKRLRPQPKTFGGGPMPRTVSLSALFKRQQELRGGSSVLPLKGKRILAFTLATALLPFLETPWVQPALNHSNIRFFQPLQDGEIPSITKPFLSMEHIPIISAGKVDTRVNPIDSANSKHMVHPNASVLALGILLCELHYCTPVELLQSDADTTRNVNTDYYTSLDVLKNLEADAGRDYYLATKACLQWEYFPIGELADFESANVQQLFYQNVIKRLEAEIFKSWQLRSQDLANLESRENELCWGLIGREVARHQTTKAESIATNNRERASPIRSVSFNSPHSYPSLSSDTVLQVPTQLSRRSRSRSPSAEPSPRSRSLFDASLQAVSGQDTDLSQDWMNNLASSIAHHVDAFDTVEPGHQNFEPVRIAILDSGFDRGNPLLMTDDQQLDPRIKDARSFVHQTELFDVQDEIGHGTHALGLLLNVATCAEIYIAKIARQETLSPSSYDDIAKAIDYAVSTWKVDIISMSFGIREYHGPMKTAISNALHNQTLLFAAASNDGGNLGRAFPAKYPSVFCIHSTDGNGNPSAFNPTADDKDVNFSLLGEHVYSHWPAGMNGHNDYVNVMSGTSVATPIAAGLAASLLSFVRQQDQYATPENEPLGPWLKDVHSMDAVLKSMVRQRRGVGYDYITPHTLLDTGLPRKDVYDKIKEIRRSMYH